MFIGLGPDRNVYSRFRSLLLDFFVHRMQASGLSRLTIQDWSDT